jgi:hypothetical protein
VRPCAQTVITFTSANNPAQKTLTPLLPNTRETATAAQKGIRGDYRSTILIPRTTALYALKMKKDF